MRFPSLVGCVSVCSIALFILIALGTNMPTISIFSPMPAELEREVRRSPIFGLPETNLEMYEQNISDLQSAVAALAELQKTPEESEAVRTMVPFDFLRSLAEAERERHSFLASGSRKDLDRYLDALRVSVRTGKRDLTSFTASFDASVPDARRRYPTLGGMITRDSMREALETLDAHFDDTGRRVARLSACARGSKRACESAPFSAGRGSEVPPPRSESDVYQLWESAGGGSNWQRVAIDSSVCLAALPGPHFFSVFESEGHIRSLRYGADIFLIPLADAKSPAHRYERDVFGMAYTPHNPVKFYTCPDVGADRAIIRATLAVKRYADLHPDIATHERSLLLRPVASESAARDYLAKAVATATSTRDHEQLSNLVALFAANSDLSDLLADMAYNFERDLAIYSSGAPLDLSARTLLTTHSAFPTLFLAPSDIPLREDSAENAELFFTEIARYTDIKNSVPRERIRDDLRSFLQFEQIMSSDETMRP